jgi:hypothetical protein
MWAARRRLLTGKRSGLTRMGGSCAEGAFSPARARAYAYDEVAREEELTPERVREIVREALAERIVDDESDHAKLQWRRLAPAMQIAGMVVVDGEGDSDVPQGARPARPLPARRQAQPGYDEEARKRLFDKINRVAANLGYDHARTPADGGASEQSFTTHIRERGGE